MLGEETSVYRHKKPKVIPGSFTNWLLNKWERYINNIIKEVISLHSDTWVCTAMFFTG